MITKRTKLPYWKDRQKSTQDTIQESEYDFTTRIKEIAKRLDDFLSKVKK